LRSVVLANMPPQRFNYQQRVGRAGRQGQPFSYAITLCRDRSHDDFYFKHAERMTGDDPPQPYLDLDRQLIIRRTAAADALRLALQSLPATQRPSKGGSVHGSFGATADWPTYRPAVKAFMSSSPAIASIVGTMTSYTGLKNADAGLILAYLRS